MYGQNSYKQQKSYHIRKRNSEYNLGTNMNHNFRENQKQWKIETNQNRKEYTMVNISDKK